MSMSDLVSAYFTNDTADQDFEKQAQVELFAKLAASNGIDLNQVSEDQLSYLWNETFKTAEAEEPAELIGAAAQEYSQKKEAAAKLAEADYIGRRMAHAMTDELSKLADDAPAAAAKAADGPGRIRRGIDAVKNRAGAAARATGDAFGAKGRAGFREGVKDIKDAVTRDSVLGTKLRSAKVRAGLAKMGPAAAAYGGATAAIGGAAYGAKKLYDHRKEKNSSALDEVSAEEAVIKAAEAGWDPEEAGSRVAAVLTLGAGDSEKIASAQDLESAVDIRSLELLEMAGYPITWQG